MVGEAILQFKGALKHQPVRCRLAVTPKHRDSSVLQADGSFSEFKNEWRFLLSRV
jgi:hypothetical protein